MSTMKFNRKPPLAKSPVRTRPRRALRSATSMSVQTPPGSLTKSAAPIRRWDADELDLRSCDLRALARMASSNIEDEDSKNGLGFSPLGINKSPLFERGRFYDVYAARRNERLKRKLGIEMEDECFKKCSSEYDLAVETSTKRHSKRLESGRKSVAVDFLMDRTQPASRYSLRSSTKENKKPPLSVSFDKSFGTDIGAKKTVTTRRVARKI